MWTCKIFGQVLPEVYFCTCPRLSLLAEASKLTRYIFEVESMHKFHVLKFLFLSFAPDCDGPIRYFGRSKSHGVSFFNVLVDDSNSSLCLQKCRFYLTAVSSKFCAAGVRTHVPRFDCACMCVCVRVWHSRRANVRQVRMHMHACTRSTAGVRSRTFSCRIGVVPLEASTVVVSGVVLEIVVRHPRLSLAIHLLLTHKTRHPRLSLAIHLLLTRKIRHPRLSLAIQILRT